MDFLIKGKFKPYVRMTQRGKWVNPQAQEYLSSKAGIGLQLKAQMNRAGWEMLPAKTPLTVHILIYHENGFHNRDLDNEIKALLDAAQGIAFHNDCWIDAITARRVEHHQDCVIMSVSTID